jgi:hypothetical protein
MNEWNRYKVVAEVLRIVSVLAKICNNNNEDNEEEDYGSILLSLVLPRLQAADADQEVKDAAISATACLFANLGDRDLMAKRVTEVLGLLRKRLENEATRVGSLKAIVGNELN